MGIVTVEELNRHMSSPRWANEQEQAATRLLEDVEGSLAAALGTYITPPAGEPFVESVPVSSRTGLVMAAHPVHEVVTVNDAPASPNYVVRSGRLYAITPPTSQTWVRVAYTPGWGAAPALHDAILERAAVRFDNRHDDTITIRDDSTTRNNTSAVEKPWPDEQTLANLRTFRKIGIFR